VQRGKHPIVASLGFICYTPTRSDHGSNIVRQMYNVLLHLALAT
jgi:hypothetical protein